MAVREIFMACLAWAGAGFLFGSALSVLASAPPWYALLLLSLSASCEIAALAAGRRRPRVIRLGKTPFIVARDLPPRRPDATRQGRGGS